MGSYKTYADLETVISKLFLRGFSWEAMVHLKILQEWTRDFFFLSLRSYSSTHGPVCQAKTFCGTIDMLLGIFSPFC